MDKAPKAWHDKYGPAVEESIRRKEPGQTDEFYKNKTRESLDASWGRVTPEKRAEFMPKGEADPTQGKALEGVLDGLFAEHKKRHDEEDRDLIFDLLTN
jgi:hypothetical protein